MLGSRPWRTIASAPTRPSNYRALAGLVRVSRDPTRFARRYLVEGGTFPFECRLRTPLGPIRPVMYSHHDMLTANEVFCRQDYRLPPDCQVVVDIGANVGLTALYFLTRAPGVRVHMFEPDPDSVRRIHVNLAAYANRWVLHEYAVGDREATVSFGRDVWSGSGRYGGIGVPTDEQIEVRCLHINAVLRDVLSSEGRVDFLKIDTEGLERATVNAIDRDLLQELRAICFETTEPVNPWPERFAMTSSAPMCRLTRR